MFESIKTINERELQEKINDIIDYYIGIAVYIKTTQNSVHSNLIKIPSNIDNIHIKKNIRKCISLGVKPNTFFRIINTMKQTKNGTYSLLRIYENPFDFIEEDIGCLLSFNCCDKIVKEFNLIIDEDQRNDKFIISLFSDSIYILKETFLNKLSNKKFNTKNIVQSKFNGIEFVTTLYLHRLQRELTKKINSLYLNKKISYDNDELIKFIEIYETEKKYNLSQSQKLAIHNLVETKLGILTGFPGSGKTDILDCVSQYLQLYHGCENISLTAPTGLATNNLVDRCKIKKNPEINFNLFKLLYHIFDDINFSYNLTYSEKNTKINNFKGDLSNDSEFNKNIEKKIKKISFSDNLPDLIVVDESSMINLRMFVYLIDLCETYDIRLILAGDINQLPSIGGGCPFKDIIDSGKYKINTLDTIYRNSGNLTKIIMNMNYNIITSNYFTDNSIQFIPIKNFIEKNKLNYSVLKNFITSNNLSKYNTKFLTPQKRDIFGYFNLNKNLQNIFNNNGKNINFYDNSNYFYIFKDNDLVMKTVNSYNNDDICEANGDTGKISYLEKKKQNINVYYDRFKNDISKPPSEIKVIDLKNEFILAYALSIHKAQGQGYENIVIFMSKSHNFMWTNNESKNLLYTAISRASKRCFIIGDYDLFIRAQKSTIINPSKFMKFKN